jgi:hypothetical protein
MGSQRLRHDVAFAAATALLDMVCGALMDAERKDFHDEAYHIVLATLEAYDQQAQREATRLKPSRN